MTCVLAVSEEFRDKPRAGTDLVDVHVGLGAGTGLEDDEGKVLHANLAGDDLVGGLLDGVADLLVEAVGHVDLGGGALEDGKGLDEGERHALGLAANVKVLDRAVDSVSGSALVSDVRPVTERGAFVRWLPHRDPGPMPRNDSDRPRSPNGASSRGNEQMPERETRRTHR